MLAVWSSKLSFRGVFAQKVKILLTSRQFSEQNVVDPIVMTDDRSMFVCWHPEKPYPYEFTKPMPTCEPKTPQILKTDDCSTVMKKKKQLQEIDELAKITYTTKHRWFPRSKLRLRGHKMTHNREFL